MVLSLKFGVMISSSSSEQEARIALEKTMSSAASAARIFLWFMFFLLCVIDFDKLLIDVYRLK